jgi:hypothetical protein
MQEYSTANGIAGFSSLRLLKHGGLVLGENDTFVKLAANLPIELTN